MCRCCLAYPKSLSLFQQGLMMRRFRSIGVSHCIHVSTPLCGQCHNWLPCVGVQTGCCTYWYSSGSPAPELGMCPSLVCTQYGSDGVGPQDRNSSLHQQFVLRCLQLTETSIYCRIQSSYHCSLFCIVRVAHTCMHFSNLSV